MDVKEREFYWNAVETGSDPLLCSLHSMVERWSLPAVALALSSVAKVQSEDVEQCATLTTAERSLLISSCALVADVGDRIGAEMKHFTGQAK